MVPILRIGWVPLFLVLLSVSNVFGENTEKELSKFYENKAFVLRYFYSGRHLKYDLDGTLVSGGKPGIWTTNGFIKIDKLKIKKNRIELIGRRKFWGYDQEKNEQIFWDENKQTKIEIALPDTPRNLASLNQSIQRIFLQKNKPLDEAVPVYWENIFKDVFYGKEIKYSKLQEKTFNKPAGNFSEPKLIKSITPVYTTIARKARLKGMVRIKGIIQKNGRVAVEDISLPLGLGMDEQAIEAVSKWEFQPGYDDKNQLIDFRVEIDVNFWIQ